MVQRRYGPCLTRQRVKVPEPTVNDTVRLLPGRFSREPCRPTASCRVIAVSGPDCADQQVVVDPRGGILPLPDHRGGMPHATGIKAEAHGRTNA
jgi:hypothetical protein